MANYELKTTAWRNFDEKLTYRTAASIEAEQERIPFITYPKDYDFNNAQDRFLNDEERARINRKKKQLKEVDFEKMMGNLEVAGIDPTVMDMINDMYYGKPIFMTALTSGADINLNEFAARLMQNRNNPAVQKKITETFCAQLTLASFKGVVRDYYTAIMVAQGGKPAKPSRMFMGMVDSVLENMAFEINTEQGHHPQIIDALRDDLTVLKTLGRNGQLNANTLEDIVRHSFKKMDAAQNFYARENIPTQQNIKR